jgi:Cof subfamily protein (haloacid dehalogenase superfamily)
MTSAAPDLEPPLRGAAVGVAGWRRAARNRPALVATDLDGTLLRADGTVSDRTVEVFRRLAEAGVETVLVTARPPRWLHGLEHVVGGHGIALCGNGAFVYDVARRSVIASRTIDATLLEEVAADLRRALPGTGLAAERRPGLAVEAGFAAQHDFGEDVVLCELIEGLADAPVAKLLARCEGVDAEEFYARVTDVVAGRLVVSHSGSGALAEMAAPGVTKAAALEEWSERQGVAQGDVWAFGDMPNDIPMLEWAGTSFAVANGHPDVRATADHTCPANDEDGVAQVLETLLH